ncbi:hypothetical protein [Ferrimonas marina]|uniref:Carboxypeptidase regulatory-like domain-containing protein n=1 Tax=Ferrimonas marina TaxID=299255 RepID=A0A1M5YCC5_9GAMM|nr:hypothetical protein [Ferrimonas marina]SHI09559.1 hypothetical protein SAMN02745129_4065 [Ferrimonas marina]
MNNKISILAASVASALVLAGCGSSSDSGDKDKPVFGDFQGVVNKGIVANAQVTVCEATSTDCSDEEAFMATVTTDVRGHYRIENAPAGVPLLVMAKADANTLMTCDVAQCGDGVAFGDKFHPGADFELKAATPGVAAKATDLVVNVTSLTDIAAGQAIAEAGSQGIGANTIRRSNDVVRQAFNLDENINQVGAVDLTDAEQMANASTQDQLAAVYSASVYQAQVENPELDMAELIEAESSDSYRIDTDILREVIGAAGDVTETVDEHHDDLDMTGIEEGVNDADSNVDDIEQGGGTIVPDPDLPDEEIDEVEAAKKFVGDVRSVVASVSEGGDLNNALHHFAEKFEGLEEIVGDDMAVILEKVEYSAIAIAEAYEEGSHPNVEIDSGKNTYSITGIDGVTFVATIDEVDFDWSESEGCDGDWNDNYSCTEQGYAELDLSIDELAVTENATQLSATGSAIIKGAQLDSDYERDQSCDAGVGYCEGETEYSEQLAADQVEFNLVDASISNGEASFVGSIELAVKGLRFAFEDEYGHYNDWNDWNNDYSYEFEYVEITAESIRFALDGALNHGGEFAEIGLLANLNNELGFVFKEQTCDIWQGVVDRDCEESRSSETEDSYVKALVQASAAVDVDTANNENVPASISLKVERAEFDRVDASVNVLHQDTTTLIEAALGIYDREGEYEAITAKNFDGSVVMTLDMDDNGRLIGNIAVEGVHAADIEEASNGMITIRYINGDFESIL